MTHATTANVDPQDLVISRLVHAPRARLWRAWTDPDLLKQWWCPKPWTTQVRAFELHAGGAFHTFMQGPDGGTSDNPGCFLEVTPQARIVFTSLLTQGWRPATPWLAFTAVISMADEGPQADDIRRPPPEGVKETSGGRAFPCEGVGTRYVATVMHPDKATRDRHEEMGFFAGWNTCIDQLEAFAQRSD